MIVIALIMVCLVIVVFFLAFVLILFDGLLRILSSVCRLREKRLQKKNEDLLKSQGQDEEIEIDWYEII